MTQKNAKLSRRTFLLTLGAGGAATAAAIVAKTASDATASKSRRETRGYQETAHVRNYYRTAKV